METITALTVGLVMGLWTGAYLIKLWDSNAQLGKILAKGIAAIAGMGGIPSAAFFPWIRREAIFCVLSYMIALIVPLLIVYVNTIRRSKAWISPSPERFERD